MSFITLSDFFLLLTKSTFLYNISKIFICYFSSGLNTFFESHFKDTPKNKKHQIKEFRHTHENLSADDLFSSLSELWETKENKQRRKIGEVPNEEIHLNKEQNKKTKSEKQKIYKNETKIKLNLELLEKNDREIKDAQEEKIKINQEKPAKVENKNNQEKININDTGEELKLNQEELKSNEKQNISFHLMPPKKFVEENETNINHWMRIRAIVENMKSIFLQTYGENSRDKLEILNMLDKMMEIGDKINAIRNIEDTFDNNLLEFLKSKWIDMKSDIISSNPVLNALLSIDGKILLLEIAKGLVRQFGQTFHKQAFAHIREQDFVIETMRQSGFKDSEIYEVFDLLDLPKDLLVSSSETLQTQFEGQYRFFGAVQGRGGGHGGHGGGHGGYYSMMKKDPLLLLAGLAFAIFAAYVIYRLLSSTPAPAKRSSDIFNTLTLTDMPEFVTKVYSWLENAEKLYRSSDEVIKP